MILLMALALGAVQDEKETLVFRIISDGKESGFQAGMEKFVSSEKDWVALWTERSGNLKTKAPHPRVDFEKYAVVVVALGRKNSDGYAIEISGIVKTKDDIRIFLRKTAPAAGSKPAEKVTSPFVMARIEKPDRPVVFLDEPKK